MMRLLPAWKNVKKYVTPVKTVYPITPALCGKMLSDVTCEHSPRGIASEETEGVKRGYSHYADFRFIDC